MFITHWASYLNLLSGFCAVLRNNHSSILCHEVCIEVFLHLKNGLSWYGIHNSSPLSSEQVNCWLVFITSNGGCKTSVMHMAGKVRHFRENSNFRHFSLTFQKEKVGREEINKSERISFFLYWKMVFLTFCDKHFFSWRSSLVY